MCPCRTIHIARQCICILLLLVAGFAYGQQQVTAIITTSNTAPAVIYNNVKGAGLRKPDATLRSSWDSGGTAFTVKFNAAPLGNIKNITQYTVSGLASTVLQAPSNAIVKLRRTGNAYVNDTRIHHNFWATYSSIPAAMATSGTFNFTAPEVLLPEDAFLLNNITSGYDNIFENTINNLHASNIERVDFIIPGGLVPLSNTDRTNSGVAVFDRGTGDPFKIAAITAVDASNNPTAYGNLVPVTAANFGPNLLALSFDFCIITRDPKYYSQSRPSSPDNQNLRGVFISLADLGLAVNQRFYGYSLFGNDVTVADPNWNNYPTTTSTTSGLDPVNIMGLYKTPFSVLAVPMKFTATRQNAIAKLECVMYNKIANDKIIAERSVDGINYEEIGAVMVNATGNYEIKDNNPAAGNNFYRLKLIEKTGASGYSEIRKLWFPGDMNVTIFPNPAKDVLNIRLPLSWQHKNIRLTITDAKGRVVIANIIADAGTLQRIAIKQLAAGMYGLQLVAFDGLVQSKQTFIVTK
jgi:hypothetical protein